MLKCVLNVSVLTMQAEGFSNLSLTVDAEFLHHMQKPVVTASDVLIVVEKHTVEG